MDIRDILQKLGHLRIENRNDITQDSVEMIFFLKDLPQWEQVLSKLLGPAVKKKGEQSSKAFSDLTRDYGGIEDNQTLYYKKFEKNSIIVMIWPWMDQNQATLKVASIKN